MTYAIALSMIQFSPGDPLGETGAVMTPARRSHSLKTEARRRLLPDPDFPVMILRPFHGNLGPKIPFLEICKNAEPNQIEIGVG